MQKNVSARKTVSLLLVITLIIGMTTLVSAEGDTGRTVFRVDANDAYGNIGVSGTFGNTVKSTVYIHNNGIINADLRCGTGYYFIMTDENDTSIGGGDMIFPAAATMPVMNKYSKIVKARPFYMQGSTPASWDTTTMTFDFAQNYYVYTADYSWITLGHNVSSEDVSIQYIGRSQDQLPLSSTVATYFFSETMIDLDGSGSTTQPVATPSVTVPSSNNSSSSSSSSSRNSSNSSITEPKNTPVDITTKTTTTAVKTAITEAKAAGSSVAIVNIKNSGNISLTTLKNMVKEAGMPLKLQADSMIQDGKTVDVRITLNPAQSTQNLNLSASTTNIQAINTMNRFTKHFSNDLAIVSFEQQGSFGQAVTIAVKLASNMNTKDLVLYAYDKEANTYRKLQNTNYRIDSNGYLHFSTETAGDIIISDGILVKK